MLNGYSASVYETIRHFVGDSCSQTDAECMMGINYLGFHAKERA